jgi:hypothetical protein
MLGVSSADPQVVPMQAGCELARFPPSEEYENVGFAFDIAMGESDITRGMPTEFASEILHIIQNFGACL